MAKLETFMEKYETRSSVWTHQIKNTKYNIPREKTEKFMTLYKKAIIKGHELYVYEHKPSISSIIIKLNLLKYTSKVKLIVQLYNDLLLEYLDTKHKKMICYVLMAKSLKKDYSPQINLIYPYIRSRTNIQKQLGQLFVQRAKNNEKLSDISIDEVFMLDNTDSFLMYGSKPSKYVSGLEIIHKYNHNLVELDEDETEDEIDTLSILQHDIVETPLKKEIIIKEEINLGTLIKRLSEPGGINNKNFAYVFHRLYSDEFVYDVDAKMWFEFDENGKCIPCQGMEHCKQLINEILLGTILEYYKQLLKSTKKLEEDERDKTKKNNEKINELMGSIRKHLGSMANKEAIVKELSILYREKKIL